MASPEIFTALFELELSGRIKSLPGKNYVQNLLSSGASYDLGNGSAAVQGNNKESLEFSETGSQLARLRQVVLGSQ